MRRKVILTEIAGKKQYASKYIPMHEKASIVPCRDCAQPMVISGRERTIRLCARCQVAKQPHVGHYAPRAALQNTGRSEWNNELRRLWRQAE
jgi:hypothetical protein